MKKQSLIFFVLVAIFFVFCGCSSEMDEPGTVGYVRFAEDVEVSRSLSEKNTLMYPVDSLYWAYTAQKVDGLYTEGESEVLGTSGDTGSDGIKAGGYKLRPVKQGPATGLRDAEVGPFATGDWIFKVYGYLNYTVDNSTGKGKFDGLVYSGKTATLDNVSRVVKVASGTTGEPVVFELTEMNPSAIPEKGILGFEALKLTVPEDMRFFGTSEIKVKVFDVTDAVASDSTLLGTSTTTVSADENPSDANPVALNNVVFKTETSNVLDKKLHTLKIVAEYHDAYTEAMKTGLYKDDKGYDYTGSSYAGVLDTGYALIGEYEKKVDIRKGVKTILYGDINDIRDSSEKTQQVDDGVIIAKILKAGKTAGSSDDNDYDFYTSLSAAAADYSSNPIILVRDVNVCGTITKSVVVNPANHIMRDLYVSGSGVSVTVLPEGSTARSYILSGDGAQLISFAYSGNTVEICTGSKNGTLDVNSANDDVWHSGVIGTLNIVNVKNDTTNNKGYHVWTDVGTELKITKGFVELGETKNIKLLKLGTLASSGDVVLKGRPTTIVGNLNTDILNGRFESTETVGSMTAYQKAVFKKVTLNGNGGFTKGSTTVNKVTLYGIDGMYLTIPQFKATRTSHVCTNPIFEKSNGTVFLRWHVTSAESSVVYSDKGKIIVGVKPEDGKTAQAEIQLYAEWTLPLGGKIFAARSFDDARYTFYDANGNVLIANTSSLSNYVSSLSTAVSYEKTGNEVSLENFDNIFIFNETVFNFFKNKSLKMYSGALEAGKYGVEVGYYDKAAKVFRTLDDVSGYPHDWIQEEPMLSGSTVLGTGKTNTEWHMNLAGYWNGATATVATMNPAYYVNGTGTVWNTLKSYNTSSSTDNTTGLYDWYVGSVGELYNLIKSGVYSFSGFTSAQRVSTSSRGAWFNGNWNSPCACKIVYVPYNVGRDSSTYSGKKLNGYAFVSPGDSDYAWLIIRSI